MTSPILRLLATAAALAALAACSGGGASPRSGQNPPGPPQFEHSGERGAPRPGVYMLSNETDENPSPDAADETPEPAATPPAAE